MTHGHGVVISSESCRLLVTANLKSRRIKNMQAELEVDSLYLFFRTDSLKITARFEAF